MEDPSRSKYEFINRNAEKFGSWAGWILGIYLANVFFLKVDVSSFKLIIFILLVFATVVWMGAFRGELKIRKMYPNEKKLFFLLNPLLCSVACIYCIFHLINI
mgnify:CR=1 FL=1